MKYSKLAAFAGSLLLAASIFIPTAKADVDNQATQITFDQPVRVSNKVLAPGTYWFTVLDSGPSSGLNQIQIKNADGTKVIAQVETGTADHRQSARQATANAAPWPSGKVVLRLAEGGRGEPVTLLDWYYPGSNIGHRFVYSSRRQRRLDEDKKETLSFNPGDKITIGRSLAAFE